MIKFLKVWPGEVYLPDFSNPKTKEWWGPLLKKYLDVGLQGIWIDMSKKFLFLF